jgi:hypothetical protein
MDCSYDSERGRMTRQRLYQRCKAIGRRAGIEDVHPHRFRDTFAVDMLARGATPYNVAKLLGDEIATVAVESEWPSSVHRARPLSRSHTFSVLSRDADTARFPSAVTATPLTESEWPSSVKMAWPTAVPSSTITN